MTNSNKISGTIKQLELVDGEIVTVYSQATATLDAPVVARVEFAASSGAPVVRFINVATGERVFYDVLVGSRKATISRDVEPTFDAAAEAEIIARVTGSVGATVTVERRLPSGELVVEQSATYGKSADDVAAELAQLEADAAADAEIEKQRRFELLKSEAERVHSTLSAYELELLADLPQGWQLDADGNFVSTTRVVVYADKLDGISVGIARRAYSFDSTFDVSPFPGAWARVSLKQIVRVRHAL